MTIKKIILLFTISIFCYSSFAKKVKFSVNMSEQVLSPNGVHIMGNFQAFAGFPNGDWQPNTTLLTREADTNIYSIVVNIPAGRIYEYRYLNGDQSYEAEYVPIESRVGYDFNDNRWIYIDSLSNDTSNVAAILFGKNAPFGKKLLRFKVDFKNMGAPNINGVHIAGNFQNWNYTSTRLGKLGSNVYEFQTYLDSGLVVDYKFVNGNNIDQSETVPLTCASNSNRRVVVTSDLELDSICFATCSSCLLNGMNDVKSAIQINLYPNPTLSNTTLDFGENNNSFQINLVDITGKTIRSYSNFDKNTLIIERKNLQSGIYFITIRGENLNKTLKLILE